MHGSVSKSSGARNFIHISHMGVLNPLTWAIPAALQVHMSRRLDLEVELELKPGIQI